MKNPDKQQPRSISTWLSIKADCDAERPQGLLESVYTQLAVYYVHLAENTRRLTLQINPGLSGPVLVFCKKNTKKKKSISQEIRRSTLMFPFYSFLPPCPVVMVSTNIQRISTISTEESFFPSYILPHFLWCNMTSEPKLFRPVLEQCRPASCTCEAGTIFQCP